MAKTTKTNLEFLLVKAEVKGDVPTPWGKIHVYADRNGHKVSEIRDR